MSEPDGHCILIIEDDRDIRQALAMFLSDEGYGVVEAADGEQGLLELSRIRRPCLILLDLFMPVMNGTEFLSRLKTHSEARLANIPVVVVSAAPPDGDMVKAVLGQAQGFLSKPAKLDKILSCVARYCPPRD